MEEKSQLAVQQIRDQIIRLEGRPAMMLAGAFNGPLAFTREGANQLSGCLKSKIAEERSVQIMRAFESDN